MQLKNCAFAPVGINNPMIESVLYSQLNIPSTTLPWLGC